MKSVKITIARVYITESTDLLKPILNYLHDEATIRSVNVFRAVSGYEDSKKIHSSSLVDLSLNMPLAIEFFDHTDKVKKAIKVISTMVKAGHILFWDAQSR